MSTMTTTDVGKVILLLAASHVSNNLRSLLVNGPRVSVLYGESEKFDKRAGLAVVIKNFLLLKLSLETLSLIGKIDLLICTSPSFEAKLLKIELIRLIFDDKN